MQLPVGGKLVKSAGGPQQLCWLMVSSVVKTVGVICRGDYWELWLLLLHDCYWEPLLFFLVPIYLYTFQHCQSLGVEKSKQVHCAVPPKAGQAGCSLHSFLPGEGNSATSGK